MRHILPLKDICEYVISHLNKQFKGLKINSATFEYNMGCIYTNKSKNISPGTKHIETHVHFFRDHIYDKDKNPHGDIILE